jgi:hypothetical protein
MPDVEVPAVVPTVPFNPNKEVFTEEEAASFLGVTRRSLRDWRWNNPDGPPFARYQRLIVYRRVALLRWLEEHESKPRRRSRSRKAVAR